MPAKTKDMDEEMHRMNLAAMVLVKCRIEGKITTQVPWVREVSQCPTYLIQADVRDLCMPYVFIQPQSSKMRLFNSQETK